LIAVTEWRIEVMILSEFSLVSLIISFSLIHSFGCISGEGKANEREEAMERGEGDQGKSITFNLSGISDNVSGS
jgi:hypothetical protein